jgi:hypothetical protein
MVLKDNILRVFIVGCVRLDHLAKNRFSLSDAPKSITYYVKIFPNIFNYFERQYPKGIYCRVRQTRQFGKKQISSI